VRRVAGRTWHVDESTDPVTNYVAAALIRFAEYGEREAITTADRRLTYADLCRQVPALAAVLREHGVRPGGAIAILSGNRPETMLVQLAAHLLGCRTAWLSYNTSVREQADYLERADVEFFIYDTSRHLELATELLAGSWRGTVLCLGPGGAGPDVLASVDAAGECYTGDVVSEPESIFHTGGTTGRPKLVHHGHGFFSALLGMASDWLDSGLPAFRYLAQTGFYHVAGQMIDLWMLFVGGTLVLREGMEIPALLEVIAEERISSALFTPVQFYSLLDHPALADADLSSLLMVNIGGAAVSPRRLREGVERFGPTLRPVYGMSEAPFVTEYRNVTLDPEHPQRLRSCGYVFEFADSRIEIRDGDGRPCPDGVPGEVWTTGSLLMKGYWGEPELTRETLVDGWIRTGDIGYLEPDGFLYLVDRSKDMIVTGAGANNIFTKPIEDALTSHPLVRAASVVGVQDESKGEAILACVVAEPGARLSADELRALVARELGGAYVPHRVEFVDVLPVTGFGKVDKKALRVRYGAAAPDRAGAGAIS
jgi:fatty-acyl-CoA synthase